MKKMMMKKSISYGLTALLFAVIFALALALIGCGGDKDEHTHEWEWLVTTPATTEADGLETETCKTCGAESGNTRIIAKLELETKTFPISLKDGALVFTVEYKAYSTDAEPAYLTYIKERLETFVASTTSVNVNAVNLLLTKGNSFKITIEYAEPTYTGMEWDITLQSFKIHNDWIFTASGVTDLTLGTMRDAFNSVVIQ